MNEETTRQLAKAYRRGHIGEFVPRLVLWATVLLSPLLIYATFNDYDMWSKDSLLRALHGGYFWQDPTGFLFQQTFATLNSLKDFANNQLIFLLAYYVAMAVVFALLWRVSQLGRWAATQRLLKDRGSQLEGILPGIVRGRRSQVPQIIHDTRDISVQQFRQWVLLSVPLAQPTMHVMLTNAHRHTLPLLMNSRYEAVLEGTFLENYHVYTDPTLFRYLPRIFRAELFQYFLSLNATAIEISGSRLHVLVANKDLASPEKLSGTIAAAGTLAEQLERSIVRIPAQPDVATTLPTLSAMRSKRYQFPFVRIEKWWTLIVLFALFFSLPIEVAFMKGGINGNDVMLQVTLQFVLFALLAYDPIMRRLRIQPPKGDGNV